MVRSLIKVAIIPLVLIVVAYSPPVDRTYDLNHYKTDCKSFDFTVTPPELAYIQPFTYSPLTISGKSYIGFKEAIAFRESRGDYGVINKFGYLGKYQFGKSTLDLLGIADSEEFLNDPLLQEQAFLLNSSRNKWVLRRDIKRFSGKWIAGIKITESGILAAAHLAGPGSVKKFLRSGGEEGFSDAMGTSVKSYLKRFSGYDVSFIEADKKAHINKLRAV